MVQENRKSNRKSESFCHKKTPNLKKRSFLNEKVYLWDFHVDSIFSFATTYHTCTIPPATYILLIHEVGNPAFMALIRSVKTEFSFCQPYMPT